MSEEIKKLIDNAEYEPQPLIDYITNLQTIEQQYSAILSENAELQEENERLKEERQNINNRNCNQKIANKKLMEDIERLRTNLKTHKRRRKKQTHKKNIYKSRNEKAIENLEIGLSNYEEQEELLNILQGKEN